MISYENVRQLVEKLPSAATPTSRHVEWVSPKRVVGIARDFNGRLELLLHGPEVFPVSKTVRDASEHREVFRGDGSSFNATRLVLPALGHFDQVAAFLCTELVRNGVDSELPRAFSLTEPIIELAIERLRLSNQSFIGLAGELLILEALCRLAEDGALPRVFASWCGWRRSTRDFSLGGIGVEVKTTMGMSSSHFVEGVHQTERQIDEEQLLLVSIGLQQASGASSNSFTVPQLVNRIVNRLSEDETASHLTEEFLQHIAEYGAGSGGGYDHSVQSTDPAYTVSLVPSFVRAYNMDDANLMVLRSSDIAKLSHVVDGTVSFKVELSARGRLSAENPIEGTNQVACAILRN